jgi:ABC-type lipoprotein release transport system permease subunit
MAALWLVVRADLRQRWRSLAVLTLLVALAGGVVLTALAGARRTDSALPRLLESTRHEDVNLEISPDWFAAVAALPEVEAVAPLSFLFVAPTGWSFEDVQLAIAGTDDRLGSAVGRPIVVDGRLPARDRPDEVFVNQAMARRLGLSPGDPVTLDSLSPRQLEQLMAGEDPGPPAGPTLEVRVVGVGHAMEDIGNSSTIIVLTAAFYEAHREDVAHYDDLLSVRLHRGQEDLASFRDSLLRAVPATEGVVFETTEESEDEIRDATGIEAVSLLVIAGTAALAGIVVAGQALARHVGAAARDQSGLRALGFDRRQRALVLVSPLLVVAALGAALAALVAVLASPLTPTGFARQVEPDPGIRVDGLVIGLGAVVVVVVVTALGLLAAWIAAGRQARTTTAPARSSPTVARLARLGMPPPAVVGARLALEAGSGRSAVPVRQALAGAVVGIAGVVAALVVGSGLQWVVHEREAYGWTWDTAVHVPGESEALARETARIAARPDVDQASALGVLPIRLAGIPIQAYGLDAPDPAAVVTVTEGRLPRAPDEVLVGAETLDRLGRGVGDEVAAQSFEGRVDQPLTVVGLGVFPEFVQPGVPDSDTGAYNDFALLTAAGAEAFVGDAGGEYFGMALIDWTPGTDQEAAAAQLGLDEAPPDRPTNLDNLTRVEWFPRVVAALLVLLAGVAAGHALVVSTQRRARDLALLRTLGFVGGQVRSTIAWQASTVALIGLLVGIPAGLVLGRVVWALAAGNLGVDTDWSVPVLAVLLTLPATFAIANVIGLFPARTAIRARLGQVLRAE